MSTEPAQDNSTEGEEDKINWLRQRGVEIELAGEREAYQAEPNPDKGFGSFTYLRLPADEAEPPEVLTAFRDGCDVLPRLLKRAFVDGGVARSVLEAQMAAAGHEVEVSAAAVERTLAEGCVETFPLARPSEASEHMQTNLYLDEVGALKMLPRNPRATRLAQRCGFEPPPALHGDVYLARVAQQPLVANTDMSLDDLATDAPWLHRAAQDNLEAQHRAMEAGVGPTEAAPEPGAEQQAEGYRWSQTEEDLEVLVPVPVGTKPKQISVKFKSKSVSVKAADAEELVLGPLLQGVDLDGCSWTVDGKEGVLCVTLEKQQHNMWPTLLE